MMPVDTAKDAVTIYRYRKDADSGVETYIRTVIIGVAWRQDSHVQYKKTGEANINAVSVFFPWRDFGTKWGVDIGGERETSYLVRGDCPYDFVPGTGGTFVREQIKPFEREYAPFRPREIIPRKIGSRHMWHVEVRC